MPKQADATTQWHVRYRMDAINHVEMYANPDQAIEVACHYLDDGLDVYGIDRGIRTDAIGKAELSRI
jgi:hypothetical protein